MEEQSTLLIAFKYYVFVVYILHVYLCSAVLLFNIFAARVYST